MQKLRFTIFVCCSFFLACWPSLGQTQALRPGPTAAALQLASSLDSYDSPDAAKAIALSYWRHGQYEAAFAQLEKVEPEKQIEFLYFLASEKPDTTPREQVVKALSRAQSLTTGDADLRDSSWIRGLARCALAIDDFELASKFADGLAEGSVGKAEILIAAAEARTKRGDREVSITLLDDAVKQFASFDEDKKSEVFYFMAPVSRLLVTQGRKERAAELMQQADRIVVRPTDLNGELYTSQMAQAYAEAGDFNRALTLIETIEDERKIEAVSSLAIAYAAKGDESAALASLSWARQIAASSFADDHGLSISLNEIAQAYLGIGRPEEAFEVLRSVRHDFYLPNLAVKVADGFARKGRRAEAIAALDFAFAQIRKIVSEKSDEIPAAASSSSAQTKSQGLVTLGKKYIELDDLVRAETVANAMDQPQYKASLLVLIAAGHLKAGDQGKGKSLLASAFKISSKSADYKHDAFRETVLLRIGEAYATAGFKQEAANVVLRFLAEIRDGEHGNSTIGELMEIGLVAETNGIPVGRKAQQVLSQVITQFKEN